MISLPKEIVRVRERKRKKEKKTAFLLYDCFGPKSNNLIFSYIYYNENIFYLHVILSRQKSYTIQYLPLMYQEMFHRGS